MKRLLPCLLLGSLAATAPALTPMSFLTEAAFPNLTFTQPILLLEAPDNSNRIFVLERAGIIKVFPNSDTVTPAQVSIYLNITDRVSTVRDFALNGFDFHPDFATNGEIYVHYNWRNGTDETDLDYGSARISRFTAANPADNTINAGTEEILHQHRKTKLPTVAKPLQDHNGGTIAFGPDGMLYVVFGDGGSDPTKLNTDPEGQDPLGNAQNTENFLGKIIRIDVDSPTDPGLGYRIPTDNPFFTTPVAGQNTLKEIWAYGLRNPWRFSFDNVTGNLFAVDVGAKTMEEINLIEPGKNYGWRLMEGTTCFPSPPAPAICDQTGLTPPILEHTWTNGEFRSLTGGYTYRGTGATQLDGLFIYGDYVWGGIWGMAWDGTTATSTKLLDTSLLIAGFGQDRAGEVYVLGYTNGKAYRLRANPAIYPTASPATEAATETVALNGTLMATDGGTIASYMIVTPPALGTLNLTAATGAYVYTANNLAAPATDSFRFKAIDNDGNESNIATVTFNIQAANDIPAIIGSRSGFLPLGDDFLALGGESLDATDPDSSASDVIFEITTAPTHGTILVEGSPVTSFTAAELQASMVQYQFTGSRAASGSDSFVVTARNQGEAASAPSTFNITIEQPAIVGDWIILH